MSDLLKNWRRLSRHEQEKFLLECLQGDTQELTKKVINDNKWIAFGAGILVGIIVSMIVVTTIASLL